MKKRLEEMEGMARAIVGLATLPIRLGCSLGAACADAFRPSKREGRYRGRKAKVVGFGRAPSCGLVLCIAGVRWESLHHRRAAKNFFKQAERLTEVLRRRRAAKEGEF